MKLRWIGFSTVLALLGLAVPASAVEITGTIGFGGGVIYDNLGGGLAAIDWEPLNNVNPTGTGDAIVIKTSTGYFAGVGGYLPGDGITKTSLSVSSGATILDITNDPAYTGATYAPSNTLLNIQRWIDGFTDPDSEDLHFDLTFIPDQTTAGVPICGAPGSYTSCYEGPFLLTETVTGLRVDFDVFGYWINGGDSGYYKGAFSATFIDLDLDSALALLVSGQDLTCGGENVTCTWDGNFTAVPQTTVPEPASLVLFGTGAALLGGLQRRRAKRQQK